MDTKPNLGGRPRKSPDGEARSETVKFLMTPSEKAALKRAAEVYGLDIASFIRQWIKSVIESAESESKVDKVLSIGRITTDGWELIPDLDLPPMEIVWDTDESKPKLVEVE